MLVITHCFKVLSNERHGKQIKRFIGTTCFDEAGLDKLKLFIRSEMGHNVDLYYREY